MLDLVIIGGGPAALSGAIYAARAGLSVKVFEKSDFGGILPQISQIENYPGFLGTGRDLATSMRDQAKQAGAILEYGECTNLKSTSTPDESAPDRIATTSNVAASNRSSFDLAIDGELVQARTVLVASGSNPKHLSFDLKIPVSYCALCDGPLVKGKNVVVVGGANSAVQEALYLAKIARQVTIVTHSQLKADAELLERLPHVDNISAVENLEPTPDYLNQFDYCFVYIGKTPATTFLSTQILDQSGYIICSNAMASSQEPSKYPHQTAIKGLFAAGDVRQGSIKQVVTAVGDGAAAAIEITDFLKS